MGIEAVYLQLFYLPPEWEARLQEENKGKGVRTDNGENSLLGEWEYKLIGEWSRITRMGLGFTSEGHFWRQSQVRPLRMALCFSPASGFNLTSFRNLLISHLFENKKNYIPSEMRDHRRTCKAEEGSALAKGTQMQLHDACSEKDNICFTEGSLCKTSEVSPWFYGFWTP